jgi:hypothetical protein
VFQTYNYETYQYYKEESEPDVDLNGNLVIYTNGKASSLDSTYSERSAWIYSDYNVNNDNFSEKYLFKYFPAKTFTEEYRKPDFIVENGGDIVGYNYDKPNEITLLIKEEYIEKPLYMWCALDAETIADAGFDGKLTVYHNTLKKYPDKNILRVGHSRVYGAQVLIDDFNAHSDKYEAILSVYDENTDYDILLLDDADVLPDGVTQFPQISAATGKNDDFTVKLTDIYELMGDSINEKTTYMNLLRSDETDGKLYALTPRYTMTIPIAYEEYIEDGAFKTLDDVISLEKSTENWLFANYSGNSVFQRFFPFVYIGNAEKGITELDTPELRNLLDFGALYKDGTQTEDELKMRESSPLSPYSDYIYVTADSPDSQFIVNDIRNKYYLSTIFTGSAPSGDGGTRNNIFTNYSSVKNLYFGGEDLSFPGVPDMGQTVLTPYYEGLRVCVPEKPSDTEAAKAFISWICADDAEMKSSYFITPSKLSMEATAAAALKSPRTHENSKGETVRDEIYLGLEKIAIPDVTEADVNELLSAFEGNVYISKQGYMFDYGAEYYSWVFKDITDSYYKGKMSYEKLLDKIKSELEYVIY